MVLAHSEQSTLWARGVPNAVVYSSTDAVGSRKVEGKGFEARAYLQAIVDHWDALPEAMAFVHAHNRWVEGWDPPVLFVQPWPRSHRRFACCCSCESRSWHVKVGNGKLNSSEWKLTHLRWPTLEYYTPLSVSCCCCRRCCCRQGDGRAQWPAWAHRLHRWPARAAHTAAHDWL